MVVTLAGCRGLLGIDADIALAEAGADTSTTNEVDAGSDASNDVTTIDSGDPNAIGFRGHYGFVVDYACTDEATARGRIDTMVATFGIREVQFYDWFASYSQPTNGTQWMDPWFHTRTICLQTIQWYIEELHAKGGRAWAYVQSIASEDLLTTPEDNVFPLDDASGNQVYIGAHPTYFPNAAWADHQVNIWGSAVKTLGFDGIHWDTIGPVAGDPNLETTGIHAFLGEASSRLSTIGLRQTMNFVNVSWWDISLLTQVEFPYFEVWTADVEQNALFTAMQEPGMPDRKAVMAFYPSVDIPDGGTQSSTMIGRWNDAAQHNLHYLVVGDGTDRLVTDYFPTAIAMTQDEIGALTVPAP